MEAEKKAALEAVLFAAGNPLTIDHLIDLLGTDKITVMNLITNLQEELSKNERGLTLRFVAGGYQLVTKPQLYPYVEKLSQIKDKKIAAPTMETLAIIAFKQPITKTAIEDIRGVRVDKSLAKLLELNLVEEQGRLKTIGHPIVYGTTDEFLQCFGLNSLDDLPALPESEDFISELTSEQIQLLNLDNNQD